MMDMDMSENVQGTMNIGVYQGTGSVIGGILSTVIQLLIVTLIISLVIGLVVWLKNKYLNESFEKGRQFINKDPMLKAIFVLASTLIAVIVVLYLLNILVYGGYSAGRMGFISSWSVSGILTFFVKLLTVLFVVALIAFLYNYMKQNINEAPVSSSPAALLTAGDKQDFSQAGGETQGTEVEPDSTQVDKDYMI